ncbi:quinone oxidoreductase family protein [Deminuibacter soli]|uniref:Zinc-binding alcohol dehydrogenase family protein n=1 Tax=Deminuibacter soli TaxID=2291815 RepID=A0A3E1NEL0_9BACT|nr:zinc-binding alcohol dehydrogenase family protein [Deminuibacter soli]RFM26419.1 zinc-binding alcohol dehydrogenase family protein [Deminuibacter soli]
MKAAVLYSGATAPQYADVAEPVPQHAGEVLVPVKAVALKHFDKSRVKGTHYSSSADVQHARIIGGDGVCLLADGTRVYALGNGGMMAEKAIVERDRIVPVPAALDDSMAAALPNAVIGSAMALRFRAGIEPGDTVLVNGATGFTGRVAVQVARQYGAGKIIATGRNEQSLQELLNLGADEIISLQQSDEAVSAQLRQLHRVTPVHIIIDYLWGHTAELILGVLQGNGAFTQRTRFVSVGAMGGDLLQLSAANLRSVDLQLSGSGLGSWTKSQVGQFFSNILPEMFGLAAAGKLQIKTTNVALADIENLWDVQVPDGGRLVVQV